MGDHSSSFTTRLWIQFQPIERRLVLRSAARLRAAALWTSCRSAEALQFAFGNRWDDGFAILMYHRVAEEVPGVESPTMNVTPAQLRRSFPASWRWVTNVGRSPS